MIKFEKTYVCGIPMAMEGMRAPMQSYARGDTQPYFATRGMRLQDEQSTKALYDGFIGPNDYDLGLRLTKAGREHRKYLRYIHVQTCIVAPSYWVSEHDTYKISTTRNSESFMHKGVSSPFEIEQFDFCVDSPDDLNFRSKDGTTLLEVWGDTLNMLNALRDKYLETRDEKYFQLIRKLLPSGWKIRYYWDASYETLANIYHQRENHRLPEWHTFCAWIKTLPHSELITGEVAR